MSHVALIKFDLDEVDRDDEEWIGIHIPFSHAYIDQLDISKVVTITQDQHPAG